MTILIVEIASKKANSIISLFPLLSLILWNDRGICIRNALHSSFLLLEWMQLRKIKSKTDLFYPCYLLHLFTNARNFNPYLRSFLRYLHFILFIHYFAVEVLIIIISFTVILQDPTHLQRQVIVWWLRICQVQYLGR